jgi:uncharacterized membrane protein
MSILSFPALCLRTARTFALPSATADVKGGKNLQYPVTFVTFGRLGRALATALMLPLALSACQSHGDKADVPGDREDTHPYSGVAADETLRFTGTEPFWGGQVSGRKLTYETPENPEGETIAVDRFEGRGGLSWSGALGEASFTMTVTPAECSDGMSDRTYPFVATLQIGEELRSGCAWTDSKPFTGPPAP